MQYIYPDLYRVDELSDVGGVEESADENDSDEAEKVIVPQPPRLQLSYERIAATGMYLLDKGDSYFLYLSRGLHQFVLERIFGVTK